MTNGYQPIVDDERKVKPPPNLYCYNEAMPDDIHGAVEAMRWEIERQKTHAREGWERVDELKGIAERLLVLATKWVHTTHHDWDEVKQIAERL